MQTRKKKMLAHLRHRNEGLNEQGAVRRAHVSEQLGGHPETDLVAALHKPADASAEEQTASTVAPPAQVHELAY
jgi:hypothetical protein